MLFGFYKAQVNKIRRTYKLMNIKQQLYRPLSIKPNFINGLTQGYDAKQKVQHKLF